MEMIDFKIQAEVSKILSLVMLINSDTDYGCTFTLSPAFSQVSIGYYGYNDDAKTYSLKYSEKNFFKKSGELKIMLKNKAKEGRKEKDGNEDEY